MTSKSEPNEQVKFLVSCIRNANAGRPDFQAVATELGIVSKAAAQKRYERMLKANGVTAANANSNQNPNTASPAGTGGTGAEGKAKATRKRSSTTAGIGEEGTPTKRTRLPKTKVMKQESDGEEDEAKPAQTAIPKKSAPAVIKKDDDDEDEDEEKKTKDDVARDDSDLSDPPAEAETTEDVEE